MALSWISKMFRVGGTRDHAPIFVHWSVPALCIFLLGTGVSHIVTAAASVAAYLAMLLVHELGHEIVARRLGYRVGAIKIYPIHGSCWFETPNSRFHETLIAWGGPVAQFAVAAPLATFVIVAGPTRIEPIDAILAILGFFGPLIALLNLLPIAPLDGHKAWTVIPLTWHRVTRRAAKRLPKTAMEAMEDALKKASKRRGA